MRDVVAEREAAMETVRASIDRPEDVDPDTG